MDAQTLINFCGGFLGVFKEVDTYFCCYATMQSKKWVRELVWDDMKEHGNDGCVPQNSCLWGLSIIKGFYSLFRTKCYRALTFFPPSPHCWAGLIGTLQSSVFLGWKKLCMRSVPIRIHYLTALSILSLSQRVRTPELVQCSSRMRKRQVGTEVCSLKVRNLGESYVKP